MSDEWAVLSAVATAVATLVALLSALASWRSSVRAKRDRVGAEQAKAENLALTRQMVAALESQAESQRAIAERRSAAPSPASRWSEARNVSGSLFAVRNTGPDEVKVLAVTAVPAHAQQLVEVRTRVPGTVGAGGELRFFAMPRLALAVQSITITWAVGDGAPEETTVPLD